MCPQSTSTYMYIVVDVLNPIPYPNPFRYLSINQSIGVSTTITAHTHTSVSYLSHPIPSLRIPPTIDRSVHIKKSVNGASPTSLHARKHELRPLPSTPSVEGPLGHKNFQVGTEIAIRYVDIAVEASDRYDTRYSHPFPPLDAPWPIQPTAMRHTNA